MLNQCNFIGNLGADPEIRSFGNGNKVCNLRLAVSERWRDKTSGEQKEKTEWVSVAIFSEGLIKVAEQYLRKGSKVYLEGQMQTRKWTDKDGAEKYSTEIVLTKFRGELVLLDGRADTGGASDSGGGSFGGGNSGYSGGGLDDDPDAIPF
jgi:single-strand DNA-binding protein